MQFVGLSSPADSLSLTPVSNSQENANCTNKDNTVPEYKDLDGGGLIGLVGVCGRLVVVDDLLNDLRLQSSLVCDASLSRPSAVRHPRGGCTRSSLFQHAVDLLEGKALGLGNEDVSVDEAGSAEGAPDKEHAGLEVGLSRVAADHVWGDNSNDAVPEPVGGSRQGNTTRSDWQREDLTNENPGTRAPSCGEEEDVDTDECDLGGDSRVVVELLPTGSDTNNANNELADQHAQGTPDEDGTTAESLNDPEGDGSRTDVDQSSNETDKEGVGNRAQSLEEGGTEVEDEVDTGPLLHHLERGSEDGSAQVRRCSAKTTSEASHP